MADDDDGVKQLQLIKQLRDETRFWKLKYFELQTHTSQVITALSRQDIVSAVTEMIKEKGQQ